MTPAELASQVYDREACPRTFREDLEAHLLRGYVFSTPEFFVMARPVDSSAPYELVTDAWHVFPQQSCDAWWVYLMAGDMAKAWPLFPYRLPKIGFERKNAPRYYGFEFLESRIVCVNQAAPTSLRT